MEPETGILNEALSLANNGNQNVNNMTQAGTTLHSPGEKKKQNLQMSPASNSQKVSGLQP